MEFNINVIETLSRKVTVEENSIEDALLTVEEMYRNEEIVLDYSDFHGDLIIEKQEDSFNSRKDFLINKILEYLIKDEKRYYEELEEPDEHIYLSLIELKKYI